MSKDAVKYGRMSKRQRAQVADEASQLGKAGSADSFSWTTLTSSTMTSSSHPPSLKLPIFDSSVSQMNSSLHPGNSSPQDGINAHFRQDSYSNDELPTDAPHGRLPRRFDSTTSSSSSTNLPLSPSPVSPHSPAFESPHYSEISSYYNNSTVFSFPPFQPQPTNPPKSTSYQELDVKREPVVNDADPSSQDIQSLPLMAQAVPPNDSSPPPTDSTSLSSILTLHILEAHRRTCLYSTDQLRLIREDTIAAGDFDGKSSSVYAMVKSFPHPARRLFLWRESANQLTLVVQQIIEFAKMVPGFLALPQDDQILLLKSSAFEIAVIHLSRLLDVDARTVVFRNAALPWNVFHRAAAEGEERHLVVNAFGFAQNLRLMNLTEREVALYCSVVLFTPDRVGVKDVDAIARVRDKIVDALKEELIRTRGGSDDAEEALGKLLTRTGALKQIALSHLRVTNEVKMGGEIELPELYEEIFRVESDAEDEESDVNSNTSLPNTRNSETKS